ncbi:tyrosine-type recombinase/integrase [Bacteroidota bacterium]
MIREMRIRNYSPRTITTYVSEVSHLAQYFNTPPDQITSDLIKEYLQFKIQNQGCSVSLVNQIISALKILYQDVLERQWDELRIKRPHKEKKLPVILSPQEVSSVITQTRNLKHKTILAMAYSAGLRRQELVNLKVSDIDSARMVVRIKNGKGKKDRETLLASNTLNLLRQYYFAYKPSDILFEGYPPGTPISSTSISCILKKSLKKAGINKKATIHSLRHSFATHLLEQGTNIKIIQRLLGHNSIKTTMVYLQVAKIDPQTVSSPFDNLKA